MSRDPDDYVGPLIVLLAITVAICVTLLLAHVSDNNSRFKHDCVAAGGGVTYTDDKVLCGVRR